MKKIINKYLYIIITLISFFSFCFVASAATTKIVTIFPKVKGDANGNDIRNIRYNRRSTKLSSTSYETGTHAKYFSGIGVYGIALNGNLENTYQAYCIEPGTNLVTFNDTDGVAVTQKGYTTLSGDDISSYKTRYFKGGTDNTDKITKLKSIFTFSYPPVVGFKDSESSNPWFSKNYSHGIYATQLLVWEIVDGERTSFSSVRPDNKIDGGAYDYLLGDKINSKLSIIADEYKTIVETVNSIFGADGMGMRSQIGGYSVSSDNSASTPKYTMGYNSSTRKYEFSLKDKYAFHFRVIGDSGLEITNSGGTIKISSSQAFDSKTVKFQLVGTRKVLDLAPRIFHNVEAQYYNIPTDKYPDDIKIYKSNGEQDLISILPRTYDVYLKLSTPLHKIKITKKGNDGEKLEGAKFALYDSSKKLVTDNLETDANGEVIYNNIKFPGRYYIREIKAADKYNIKSGKINSTIINASNYNSLIPIDVAPSNVSTPLEIGDINDYNQIDLIKYTVDENGVKKKYEGNCDSTEPAFKIYDAEKELCFVDASNGDYVYSEDCEEGTVKTINTCHGDFHIKYIPGCEDGRTEKSYKIDEISAGPQTITNRSKTIDMCDSDRSVSFYNGFAGIEFQKRDENGRLLSGGEFKLQKKENGVFLDQPVKETASGSYKYDETSDNYVIKTSNGISLIVGLSTGEYRVVEVTPPTGYKNIKDSEVKSIILGADDTIKTIEIINRKENLSGDSSKADLTITISTGRNVIPYGLVIGGLIIGLIAFIVIRNKNKK